MVENTSLYDRAVGICEEYLGPAGERFLQRQIRTHLNIEPTALKQKDIYTLVDWACLSFALLTDKPDEVEAFADSLLVLTNGHGSKAIHDSATR